jgi:sec-independent protein translocase protein TatB
MGFGELAVVVIVALVVMGPKELPKVLRKLGQWSGKLRRMAADLRAQSGIDDALRVEGLDNDIREIRKLARGELDGVVKADLTAAASVASLASSSSGSSASAQAQAVDYGPPVFSEMFVERDRENPREGPDAYGALSDTAIVYDNSLPKSALADDPLYVLGDANAKLPEPEPKREDEHVAEPPGQ